jgi:hypothetical protein
MFASRRYLVSTNDGGFWMVRQVQSFFIALFLCYSFCAFLLLYQKNVAIISFQRKAATHFVADNIFSLCAKSLSGFEPTPRALDPKHPRKSPTILWEQPHPRRIRPKNWHSLLWP